MFSRNPVGQRQKALKVARSMPPNSVGASIAKILGPFTLVVRNVCAGNIGDFYEENKKLLRADATDENILAFTKLETKYFKSQPYSCAGVVGAMLNAEDRAALIRKARDGEIFN